MDAWMDGWTDNNGGHCPHTGLSTNRHFIKKFSDLIQNHPPPAIGQLSGEDVPDQHSIGAHIHHHVVLRSGLCGFGWMSNILWGKTHFSKAAALTGFV